MAFEGALVRSTDQHVDAERLGGRPPRRHLLVLLLKDSAQRRHPLDEHNTRLSAA
jgi:hypothetical protein